MKHIYDITVTPQNTRDNLAELRFKVDRGIIMQTGFYFPAGCNGRVYCRMMLDTHQIFPRNQHEWAHGEDGWWSGQTDFPVVASPAQILVEAYAEGTNWVHVIHIEVEIIPQSTIPQWELLSNFLQLLGEELGIYERTAD